MRGSREVPLGWIGHGRPCDLGLIDELAHIQLAARRHGWSLRLRRTSPELAELLALTGLAGVLDLQLRR